MGPRNKHEQDQLRSVQRIGVGGFAASVEGAGLDVQKKVADNTEAAKNLLTEIARKVGGAAVWGP